MNFSTSLFFIALSLFIVSWVLYIIFSNVTVRKLRKHPDIKDSLGVEVVDGLDTLNVIQAVSFPSSWNNKLKESPISFLDADGELIKKHLSTSEIILARVTYYFFISSTILIISLVISDQFQ